MGEHIVYVEDLRSQAQRFRETAAALDRAADAYESCEYPAGRNLLGGGKLIEAVDRVVEPGEVVHYRLILDRLRDADVEPRGQRAASTLLAALGRSPYYSAVGSRTGEYRRNAPASEEASDRG